MTRYGTRLRCYDNGGRTMDRYTIIPPRDAGPAYPEFAFDLDTIARHMCIAAIWADAPEGTYPRVNRVALATARAYALAFVGEFPGLSCAAMQVEGYGSRPNAGSPAAAFGHDLYLTACGHGVGFWSRDELKIHNLGDALSAPLRDDFRKWYLQADFYRGWLYFEAPITRERTS